MIISTKELSNEMLEALRGNFDIDLGFEDDVPVYLADFLICRGKELIGHMTNDDEKGIKEWLADLTDKLPVGKNFKELFYVVFVSEAGKPRLSCVEGEYGQIDGDKVKSSILAFGGDKNGDDRWKTTKKLMIIHTHPDDAKVCFSGMDGDVKVLSEGANSFSMMLAQFPVLERAWVGLCTASKRGRVLLVRDDQFGNRHYFDRTKLLNAGEEYR